MLWRVRASRRWAVLVSAASLLVAVAACGSDDDDDGGGAAANTAATSSGAATTAPASASATAGSGVGEPTSDVRVVAGDEITTGNLLALGVQPLGGVWYSEELAPHLAAYSNGEIEMVANDEGLDIERILALEPDYAVTLTVDWAPEACDQLTAAMETVCYPYGYLTKEEVFGNLRGAAGAVGMESAAETFEEDYDARMAELESVAEERGWAGKNVGVLYVNGGINDMYRVNGSLPVFVLEELGMTVEKGTEEFGDLFSLEQVKQLNDLDAVVVYASGGEMVENELKEAEVWKNLDVVKNGKAVWVSGPAWYGIDVLALNQIVDDVEAKVLSLDPET